MEVCRCEHADKLHKKGFLNYLPESGVCKLTKTKSCSSSPLSEKKKKKKEKTIVIFLKLKLGNAFVEVALLSRTIKRNTLPKSPSRLN